MLIAIAGNNAYGQKLFHIIPKSVSALKNQLTNNGVFIENAGQYGDTISGASFMGAIRYGYEGFGMPVLFTNRGFIHLQQKRNEPSEEERERMQRSGMRPEDIIAKTTITRRVVTMEWVGANPTAQIVAVNLSQGYHTYGSIQKKASGFTSILYKELYPGIDVELSFKNNSETGFEYRVISKPGADLSLIKIKYGGDVKSMSLTADGNILIATDIAKIKVSAPIAFYDGFVQARSNPVKIQFIVKDKTIGFAFTNGYDSTRPIIIDPFITTTGNLNGVNAGKAKDVDFDYAGNIYVTGGGDGTVNRLAKFDAAGNLQWTFSGTTILPSWSFGPYYGGFVVEKSTGNVYLGQGFSPLTGYRIVRISTTGLYDNYISAGNPGFNEAWKLYWNCNSGSPQILVVGGGTSSTLNLGILVPPATSVTPLNITGASGICCQDMVDMVFDQTNFDIYSIFASLGGTPSVNNRMYKHTAPYNAGSIAWNRLSGYTTLSEAFNRPYMNAVGGAGGLMDNSANVLALNGAYLFYWDGKYLKALDKATGADVGTPLITANTALMQGGIIADACNNIFIGDGNGIIKVYQFNGTTFDDAAAADIPVPGFAGKSIYDLAYDESKKLIYASGDGFVASFDVSAYCPVTQYTLTVTPDCINSSATAVVTPAPPAGSSISYTLYSGTTPVATNTTGIFTGLTPAATYTITATINQACSGVQVSSTFTLPGAAIAATVVNTTCGNATGSITATGSGTVPPYTYSIDGATFQASGTFTGLPAGVYTITVKDANGCKNTTTVVVQNSNGPAITSNVNNSNCGSNNGNVTATVTGGTAPYQYSLNNGPFQNNNFFTGLMAGTYTIIVKDANGCTNAQVFTITSSPQPLITAVPAAATCNSSNGTITAFGSGGTGALQYSINGNTFQAGNTFTGLAPGTYTITVKDANGCTSSTTVTLTNFPGPAVTATSTAATCSNVNGTITATGTSGLAPLTYSINGGVFLTSNIFTGLAAGTYTVTVKDANGCTAITSVTVSSIGGPTVTAASTVSACNVSNGSITITASGGTPGYQYSINGTSFQASNVFAGVAGGNYVAYVKDAAGCIGTFSITVGNTAGPSITATGTPTACGSNTGTVTATGSGGTAPLQYSIDGITYGAGTVFTGLGTGIFTVYVKDANGCIKTTTVNITNSSGLMLAVSSISASCSLNNGIITATATGGVAPLQYSINGTVYQAGNIFTGLAAGSYTVYVKDASGCIVTKITTLTNATSLNVTASVPVQTSCGSSSGVVVANGTGGVPPLQYSIDGITYQALNIFVNIAAGTYTVYVKDATGCIAAQTVTVNPSVTGTPVPTDITFTIRDVLACTGGTGRIKNLKGVPGGGGNSYTFSLDGGPFTTANQFTNVAVGAHVITAKNQNGCTVSKVAVVGSGTPATATATSTASACGASTGTITIVGVGANTPYHASIDNGVTWNTFFPPGANSFTFTSLAPGTYAIIIADDADFTTGPPDIPGACLTTIYITVPSSNGPSISTTSTPPSCSSSNGSITAAGAGGVPPYAYNINGGAFFASGVFNNLAAGIYAVGIKDATNCTSGVQVTLAGAASPAVTATAAGTSCNLNNGTITVTGTGGAAPLQYSLDAMTFQLGTTFTGLAAGAYTVYVKDANNCFGSTTVTVINTPLPKATAFTIAATCNNNDGSIIVSGSQGEAPYTFSIDGTVYQSSTTFNNLAGGFYTIYIKDARGCIATTGVVLPNTTGPVISATITTAATCNNANGSVNVTATGAAPLQYSLDGITFQPGNIFTNLLPGNYAITVKDTNGCVSSKAFTIGNTLGPQLLTAVILDAACGQNNGAISASATGGTLPLQYSIDGVTYQPGSIFSNLIAGNYTVYVKDANGCILTRTVTLMNLPAPNLIVTNSPASCGGLQDGTITALATGGTLLLAYSIDGITYQASNIFTGLASGTYTVYVKDARGCMASATTIIGVSGAAVTPLFTAVQPICAGAVLLPLPATSNNGITGTWSPALNNTVTTTYTFTPAVGQCASTTTLTITVHPKPGPQTIYHN
ncbi:MAG: hypothetical protein JST86_06170 [Bacteroidetes bacterium]|nr:hypothetical protein [Bacteroidota bacterium]